MINRILLRQYRRVYRLSRWMRLHFTLLGHTFLFLLLFAGVFGIDVKQVSTYQLFVLLAVIFLLAIVFSAYSRLKVEINRALPKYVTAGQPFSYQVLVTNLSGRRFFSLDYIEQLFEPKPDVQSLQSFYQHHARPWYKRLISYRLWHRYLVHQRNGFIGEQNLPLLDHSAQITVKFKPLRRGKLIFSGAYLGKADVFGLFRRLFWVNAPQQCWVLPKRYPVNAPVLHGSRKYQPGGVTLANSVGDSAEFFGLRDYRPGDPLNRVHWKSLARHNRLIVKEYQDEYFVRKGLVLDTEADSIKSEVFEAAVSVAASLVVSNQHDDGLLDLMFVGLQSYCFTSGRGIDQTPHMQEILAAVEAAERGAFERLKQSVTERIQECSSLMIVLLQWDQPRQAFIQYLQSCAIPVAVFVVHDGDFSQTDVEDPPTHFYSINTENIAADLAKI